MTLILFFRICFLSGFLFSAWKWGDWRNWSHYYSSLLFVMVVNLSTGYLTYHHSLWVFNPDAIVTTHTIIDFINTYLALPATTLLYLSCFPSTGRVRKCAYILLWVLIYGTIEFIDHNITGGIAYRNGWSYNDSLIFDCGMFSTLRIHHTRPLWAWLIVVITVGFALLLFNFDSAEMK